MSRHHLLRLSAAFVLLLCPRFTAAAADVSTAPAKTVIIVRHAERIRPDGDVSLSERGRERAKILAYVLRDQRFRAIFVSQMIRTKETAEPIAAATGIAAEAVPADKTDVLVQKLSGMKAGDSALVVHHSGSIPKVVDGLGAGRIEPIAEDEFDRLLVITLPAVGKPIVTALRYGGK